MAAAVQLQYRLTRADIFRALLHHTVRAFWYLLLFPAVGVTAALMWILVPESRDDVTVALAMIPMGALLFLWNPWLQSRVAMKNPELAGTILATISGQGIAFVTRHSSSMRDWTTVARVSETKRAFLLHCKPAGFQIIPKANVSAPDLTALREIIRSSARARLRA